MLKRISVFAVLILTVISCNTEQYYKQKAVENLESRVLSVADWALKQEPRTVTNVVSDRSCGTIHDYYSECGSWVAVKKGKNIEYIYAEDTCNASAFRSHNDYLVRLNRIVGSLGSAYIITNDDKYVEAAMKHIKAWFCDTATMMNPSLDYAAVIPTKGGNYKGIFEGNQLIDVARSLKVISMSAKVDAEVMRGAKRWFGEYLSWLVGGPNSAALKQDRSEIGVSYLLQLITFASLTENSVLINYAVDHYKGDIQNEYIGNNGEIFVASEKQIPFIMDMLAAICVAASDNGVELWNKETEDGLMMNKAVEYLSGIYEGAVAHPSLLLGAVKGQNSDLFKAWESKNNDPREEYYLQHMAIRNPLLWL